MSVLVHFYLSSCLGPHPHRKESHAWEGDGLSAGAKLMGIMEQAAIGIYMAHALVKPFSGVPSIVA